MADNFLENRMDEYRSGRLARKSRTTTAMRSPHRPDSLVIRFDGMAVLILAGEIDELVSATVRKFADVGCRVAFTADDRAGGNSLSQATGARYYPAQYGYEMMVSDMRERWRSDVDVVVDFVGSQNIHRSQSGGNPRVIEARKWSGKGVMPEIIARHLVYLSHPDHAFLLD